MDNKILNDLQFDQQKGGLFYQGVRYLLIRPETLMAFQKAIEKELGEKASQIIYQSGFEGGSLSSKKYRETFGFSDPQIIQFMIEMGRQIGWGNFELERFDLSEQILIVKVYHSPYAEAYGSSSSSVCHFILGVLGGMASIIFGREIQAEEIACFSKGDRFCRFQIM